jgi:nicotinamide riboside kinase
LCRPDIPWEEDPLREHPEQREQLFDLYHKSLIEHNLPFTIVEGDLPNRLSICKNLLEKNHF